MSSKRKTKSKNAKGGQRREKKLERKVVKKLTRGGFSAPKLGGAIGSIFGPGGRYIGSTAGKVFKTVTGYGDYKLNSNNLIAASGDALPMFKNTRLGTNITHREYIGDVITSPTIGAFSISKFSLQPGLLASFPWLAASAENYEQYTLNGMVIEFKSNSYDALSSTNTASGTVVMTTQYNVYEPDFVNKLQMEQYEYTSSSKPSVNLIHPVECAKTETPTSVLRIRNAPVEGDLGLYDWGNFYIATVGMQGASTNIGELWFSYDITLIKNKLREQADVADHWVIAGGNYSSILPADPNIFGRLGSASIPVKTDSSDLGTTLTPSGLHNAFSLDTITFPPNYFGRVLIAAIWYHFEAVSAVVLPNLEWIPAGGVTKYNFLSNHNYNFQGVDGASMAPCENMGAWKCACFTVNGGGTIRLGGGGGTGPVTGWDLVITALPFSLA